MGLSIVILAAGQGTRMRSDLPKVLQKLAGQPLLQHVVECSKALAADDVCVVYGHGGDAVREAFANGDVRWALQAEQLGTGHAVQCAMPSLGMFEGDVVILCGDTPLLSSEVLEALVADGAGGLPDELERIREKHELDHVRADIPTA